MNGKDAPRLNVFVRSLERTNRHVLMLRYAERLTIQEISMVLDISVKEVDERLAYLLAEAKQFAVTPSDHVIRATG